jgi:hypothetical protein
MGVTHEAPTSAPLEPGRDLGHDAGRGSEARKIGSPKAGPRVQQYHGWALMLGVLLFASLIALVAVNHGTPRVARQLDGLVRPARVPVDAVFCAGRDGGHYVSLKRADLRLADGRHLPAFQVGAWHGLTGDPAFIGTGIFVFDPVENVGTADQPPALPAEADILRSASFDGRELRFDYAGRREFGRIIALDMPAEGQ